MTFDELQQLAEKDLKIDNLALDLESLKTPALHNKWLKFHNQYTQLLKKAEQDLARLTREKWEYYTGKADPSVYQAKPFNLKILKQDVDKYLKSDDEIIKLEQKVTYILSVVDYLDRTVKMISNRGFQIKNAIDWQKFTSGVV